MNDLFEFILPDGSRHMLTLHHARSFGCRHMIKRADEIADHFKSKNKRVHKKDGFVPGWQENIRMYITCPYKYRQALKDLGLVELGNEFELKDSTTTENYFKNDEMIKAAIDSGIYLSGREIDALKSGEFFEGVKPVDAD